MSIIHLKVPLNESHVKELEMQKRKFISKSFSSDIDSLYEKDKNISIAH